MADIPGAEAIPVITQEERRIMRARQRLCEQHERAIQRGQQFLNRPMVELDGSPGAAASPANTGGNFEHWLGQRDRNNDFYTFAPVQQPSAVNQQDDLPLIDLDDDQWMRDQL
jgi:hypothetical protein